jgi:hypothetical protein
MVSKTLKIPFLGVSAHKEEENQCPYTSNWAIIGHNTTTWVKLLP